MAKGPNEWERNAVAEDMIQKIVEKNPSKFGHIDTTAIGCVQIINKDKPATADWDAKIIGFPMPELMFSSKAYLIWFHRSTWDSKDDASKSIMLAEQLLKIKDEFDGGLNSEDVKGHGCLMKAFGIHYRSNPSVPDLSTVENAF